MKIIRLTTYQAAPRWLFLKIETDAGISGWGEPVIEGRAATVEAAVHELGDYLIGQDPARINDLWQVLNRGGFYRGGAILMSAIAGIDQALDQTAADAERERAFLAGADFAGIGTERGVRAARRLHHQYRASGFHRRFGFAAGGKRDRQYRHQHRNLRPVPHFAPSSRRSKLMN